MSDLFQSLTLTPRVPFSCSLVKSQLFFSSGFCLFVCLFAQKGLQLYTEDQSSPNHQYGAEEETSMRLLELLIQRNFEFGKCSGPNNTFLFKTECA